MRNRQEMREAGLERVFNLDSYKGSMDKIGYLYLDKPGLGPLNKKLLEMVNLEGLDISWLRPDDYVPMLEMLVQLPKLQGLEITVGTGLAFPDSIAQLLALEELKIQAESFPAFPEAFGKLPKLKRLVLWVDKWVGEEEHLAALRHLPNLEEVTVHVKQNQPRGLERLKQVKVLEARGLMENLQGWDEMSGLEGISLSFKENAAIKVDLSQTPKLKRLKKISAGVMEGLTLPSSWNGLPHLEEISLGDNLDEVPEIIGTVQSLRKLRLSGNRIKRLPAWLANMHSLEELHLSGNQIKEFPEAFSALKNLRVLNVDSNAVTTFPSFLLHIPGMREISLYGNKITDFPSGPLDFPELEKLYLSKNKLAVFPKAVLALPKAMITTEGNPFVKTMGYKIDQVLEHVSEADHAPEARLTLLALAVGEVKLALQSAKLPHLITALNDNEPKLRAFANDALTQFLPDPFTGEAMPRSIRILGQTKIYPIPDYKKLLQEKGITVDKDKPGAVDIVVIAERPGSEVDAYLEAGAKPASVAQLAQFVDSLAKPWLRTKAAAQPQVGENFKQLLESGSPENIQMALEMIATGGMPDEAVSAIMAISLGHKQAEVKKFAAETLVKYGSPALKAFLAANKRNFAAMSDEKLWNHLLFVINSGIVDQQGFARVIATINPKFDEIYLPFMPGPEWKAKIDKDGVLRVPTSAMEPFPAGILEIEQLEKFRWSDANWKTFPVEICKLKGLKWLNMGYNYIKELPEEILALQALEHLDLTANSFKAIPAFLAQLPKLRSLHFSSNPLGKVGDEIAQFQGLRELGLYLCGLTAFPMAVLELPHLESLRLDIDLYSSKQIKEIPASIHRLRNLRNLELGRQGFLSLPETLAELPLESLDMCDILMTEIPGWFANFKELRELNLRGSEVAKLPEQFGEMPKLETLVLTSSKIAALPKGFGRLPMLKQLEISGIVFEDKAATIEELAQLKQLAVLECFWSEDKDFIQQLRNRLPHVKILA